MSLTAATTSSVSLGSASGTQSSRGSSSGVGVGSRSTWARSTDATPSTNAWCILNNSAERSFSSPSIQYASQSGLSRSIGVAITAAANSSRSDIRPGAGNERCLRW